MTNTPELTNEPVEIFDNMTRDRFELWRVSPDGNEDKRKFVGFVGYRVSGDGALELQHTVIGERFSRQGYARTLVTHILDELRERGTTIIPTCTYVQSYLERFPQYADLVAE